MLAEQRRQKILELIQEEGSARVRQLSEIFGVSEPTIRQDLERLEAVTGPAHREPGIFERPGDDLAHGLFVVHHEESPGAALAGRVTCFGAGGRPARIRARASSCNAFQDSRSEVRSSWAGVAVCCGLVSMRTLLDCGCA